MYDFAHVGIEVKDMEKSLDFYTKVLGCQKVDEFKNDEINLVYLQIGQQIIELVRRSEASPVSGSGVISHLAFNVPDIVAAISQVKAAGATLVFPEPKEINGLKIIFILGPNGEQIEFVQKI